jgi:RNA polymerase sigma factor (TIGR02999 family)
MSSSGEVTSLLSEIRKGNQQAEARLIPLVYDELHRLAAHYMRHERPGHTLQTTALVNEAYLRLVRQREHNWQNRAHFFGLAAGLMRRILVDHARSHKRSKRGGDVGLVPLDEAMVFSPQQSLELIELDEAMNRLAQAHPRQQRIVEMRFFGGLSIEEIAEALAISPKTVKRDWSVARAWLHREIRGGQAG